MFFVFLEEKDIKMEQNYRFSIVFNGDKLQNLNFKPQVGSLNFSQITDG